ncbi:MAG: hypothetical protein ACEY3D_00690 [Rickettsia sp.]|uniref:hypothetical protein n=1 Tax=Rickettsia sp. TaxID=789 RepID=UPI00397D8EE0
MLELFIQHGVNVNHAELLYDDDTRTPLIKSILTNYSDDNYDINKFTQYLLEYPNTIITDEIIQPVLESYINESIIKIIADITKCEILYKQSNIEELHKFFLECSSKVQNVFLKRQENKFSPKIEYFKDKNHLYDELKNLEKFSYNNPALKASINDFITLKNLALLTIKSFDNFTIKNTDISKSLIEDLGNCVIVEDEESTIMGEV